MINNAKEVLEQVSQISNVKEKYELSAKLKFAASYIISDAILNQEGKFLDKDIVNKVKLEVEDQFETEEELIKYVVKKLDTMCEYGLLGRTELYYFSV